MPIATAISAAAAMTVGFLRKEASFCRSDVRRLSQRRSASASSAVVAYRCAGSFSRQRLTMRSRSVGTSERSFLSAGGELAMIALMIACSDGPSNGDFPLTIS
jgi:hypothetical protein